MGRRRRGAAARGLIDALDDLPAIDHHAHLLARPDSVWSLEELLTESGDHSQIPLVADHPAYVRAVRTLVEAFGPGGGGADLGVLRERHGAERHARRVLKACRFQEILVDDGFRFPGATSLEEHAALAGCPVRRIIRIESEAEAAAAGFPPFEQMLERIRTSMSEAALEAAALKTIAAYRYGLDLPSAGRRDARPAYAAWRAAGGRLKDPDLVAFFLHQALEAAPQLPLQVHTGLGDRDLDLRSASPLHLRWIFEDARYRHRPVVMLHCYPFVREASYLAGIYSNAFVDLSMAMTWPAIAEQTSSWKPWISPPRPSCCSPPTHPGCRSCSTWAPGGGGRRSPRPWEG